MGCLPGAQEELGGEAVPHVEHVLLHGRVQVGRVLEVSPFLTVQDEAAGRADAALRPPRFPAASPTRSLAAGTRDGSPSAFSKPVPAQAPHLSSGVSTSTVTVCCVL